MEASVIKIHQALQKILGLHRQLLDTVRSEREALANANLSGIQEATSSKEVLIESIRQAEIERVQATTELAMAIKKPIKQLTLPNLIIEIQGQNLKLAEQLRTTFNALTVLMQRISEQNQYNRGLIEKSLEHVNQMKKNVLGESVPRSDTYTQRGQRSSPNAGSRLLSKEA